jgi:hypothetical protein
VATADIRATEKSVTAKARVKYLDEIGVEFDEDKVDRIVSDVRDEAHPSCSSRTSR